MVTACSVCASNDHEEEDEEEEDDDDVDPRVKCSARSSTPSTREQPVQ